MLSSRHPPSSASGAATTPPQPTSSWLSRLPLPFDALLACASVAAGLALFCCFSFKGMRAYEQTARHMRYQDDPVLKALLLAHKVCARERERRNILSQRAPCFTWGARRVRARRAGKKR